jgi:cyclophilin-like protein
MKPGARQPITGIILCAASGLGTPPSAEDTQRIRLRMGDQTVTATLNSSEAARDLVAMLPLSIRMRDHLRREKTGPIPGPLSERTEGSPNYQSGDRAGCGQRSPRPAGTARGCKQRASCFHHLQTDDGQYPAKIS